MFKGTKKGGRLLRGQNTRDMPAVQLSQKQYLSDECISIYFINVFTLIYVFTYFCFI